MVEIARVKEISNIEVNRAEIDFIIKIKKLKNNLFVIKN
jgi:hypothetical protein